MGDLDTEIPFYHPLRPLKRFATKDLSTLISLLLSYSLESHNFITPTLI